MKNKGISLIVLVITIIVMVIMSTTIIISISNTIVNTRKQEFAKEIYTIGKLVEEYKFRENKYPVKNETVTLNLDQINDRFKNQFSNETEFSTGSINFKVLDLYEANVESVNRGLREENLDAYAISEQTGTIYYLKGEKAGKDMYYTLTSELKSLLGK